MAEVPHLGAQPAQGRRGVRNQALGVTRPADGWVWDDTATIQVVHG